MFKKKREERWALVDSAFEDPPRSLGKIVSRHGRIMEAIAAQFLWEQGQTNPRSRIIRLAKEVPEGSAVDTGEHIAPMTE
jgi:hypothetical protein